MTRRLRGELILRGDKSLSHRALMFAALALGRSQIRNLSRGADVASTARVLRSLGNSITTNDELTVAEGVGLAAFRACSPNLDCGNSGTTLRLMLGILAGSQTGCSLSGDHSLNRRPVRRVIAPLTLMGADIGTADESDRPPVTVRGSRLHGIEYLSPIASAQVKSAVLLAALNAEGDTVYTEPELSRDHTERWLKAAGATISRKGQSVILSPAAHLEPFEYSVPGDISTAAFFLVAAAVIPGSALVVKECLLNPTRTGSVEILRRMGAQILFTNERDYRNETIGDIVVESAQLTACDTAGIPSASFIDEVPALAVAAMFAVGMTRLRNIGELRVKESDRVQGIVDLAASFGCRVVVEDDDLIIDGGAPKPTAIFDPHGDHRLAMAYEITSLAAGAGIIGKFADTIAVSAPEFYPSLERLS